MEEEKRNELMNVFKNICFIFNHYQKYLDMIYENLNNNYIRHRGYLINLKEFEQLKNDVEYNFYEDNNANEYEEHIKPKIDKLLEENKSIEFERFEQVKIESSKELLDLFNDNNEYIFINVDTWNNLCKKEEQNEPYYIYYINNSELIFSVNDDKYLKFKHNNNIINKNSYIFNSNKSILSNRDYLTNIIQLYFYYNFIHYQLNSKIPIKLDSIDYCLVNSNWMNKLKTFHNFELIIREFNINNEIRDILSKKKYTSVYHLRELEGINDIIKRISPNLLINFNLNKEKAFISNLNFPPDISFIPNNEIQELLVFNNFEIMNKGVLKLFKNIHSNIDSSIKINYFSECFIVDHNIIINFHDIDKKGKYITSIGKLKNCIFKVNYILIYNDEISRKNHINRIKKNVTAFLNMYPNFNICEPLLDGINENIIGSIIKCKEDSENKINRNRFNTVTCRQNKNKNTDNNGKNYNLIDRNENTINEDINIIKQKLNEEKIKNKNLMEKVEFLKNALKEEKLKTKKKEEIFQKIKNDLENEIKNFKDLIENNNEQFLKNLSNNDINDSILNNMIEKDKEIKDLKIKLARYPYQLEEGEELITVNFRSLDQQLNGYSLICKNTEYFFNIEKRIFEDKKEYIDLVVFFTVNGKKVETNLNLKENDIKNNDIIMVNVCEL